MTATNIDVIQVARDSGMTILLDGRIGSVEYQSVSGTAEALHKFAHALRERPPGACRRPRAARSRNMNPLVPARMRERIASVVYGNGRASRARRRPPCAPQDRRAALTLNWLRSAPANMAAREAARRR
jgi:hypothetical protein